MNAKFKGKHEEWSKAIAGKDRNAIIPQLIGLSWDAAVYRVINKARGLAPSDPDGGVQLNPMFHHLLDDCFFRSQAVSIRRLSSKDRWKGSKATYSLGSVVEDMRQNVHLLTRENLLSLDGVPMDVGPVRQAMKEYMRNQSGAGYAGPTIPTELEADRMEERHAQIDRLCGVNPSNREPSDVVPATLFREMANKLDDTRDIVTWVNKFVAHAAAPESRKEVNADEVVITLRQLWDALEILCRVASILDCWLLTRHAHGFVPVASYNKFKYIDRPLITEDCIGKLEDEWRSFEQETLQWGAADLAWLVED